MKRLALATAFACATATPAAFAEPRTVTVYVFNFGYSQVRPVPPFPDPLPPDAPTIRVGDTILWQRHNGFHDVKSVANSPEVFESAPLTTTGITTFLHTYTHPGRHEYYCTFHGFDIDGTSAGGMASYIDVIAPDCPADFGTAGGLPGQDGVLDNNDFIAFITLFFSFDPSADTGKASGAQGADGLFDNNDLIAFIDLFFAGC